jgi:hypothetical protein
MVEEILSEMGIDRARRFVCQSGLFRLCGWESAIRRDVSNVDPVRASEERRLAGKAEIEVSLLSRQCLGQRRIPDLATLRGEVHAWGRRINRDRTTIDWNFTRRQARRTLHYSTTRARY